MSNPWLKFYPTDWRSDPALRMCSMAARGLWIEMIALMHEAVPYGHLLVSGRSPTDAQLAVLVGAPSDQIPELLGELDAAGVFSRTREGVIYSRKMTRTAKKAAIARKNGKNGGNPILCKEGENTPLDNQIPTDRDKPQKPEARSQKPEDIPEAKASGRDASSQPPADPSKDFWDRAVTYLKRHGHDERHARSFIGKILKLHGMERVRSAFRAAHEADAVDPIPWITAHLGVANREAEIKAETKRIMEQRLAASASSDERVAIQ